MSKGNRPRKNDPHPQRRSATAESEEQGALIAEYSFRFSGPLPAPGHLREYYEIDRSLGDRIVTMAEKEQNHRHRVQVGELILSGSGQWLGAAIIVIMFGLAAWLEVNGQTAGALAVFIPALTAFLTALATLRKERAKEAPDKQ